MSIPNVDSTLQLIENKENESTENLGMLGIFPSGDNLGCFNVSSRQNMIDRDDGSYGESTFQKVIKWITDMINIFLQFRGPISVVLTPILVLPLAFSDDMKCRCLFTVILMGVYWSISKIPIAVTAMLPVVLFPILGISTATEVGSKYISDTNFLFMGGLMVASAVEKCGLHERIALRILTLVGHAPKRILLGFVGVTSILSMFISNTATAAMMVPIVQSLITAIEEASNVTNELESARKKSIQKFASGLYLGIAFSSNVGGIGTLTGTPPNLVLVGQMSQLFGDADTGINFVSWIIFAFPLMVCCMIATWIILVFLFLRDIETNEAVGITIKKKFDELPKIRFSEIVVAILFGFLIFLWIARDPQVVPGFGVFFGANYFTDATSAMFISCLLFIIPSKIPTLENCRKMLKGEEHEKIEHLMDWNYMERNFPWSIVFLLGGGFALASGVQSSGLSASIGGLIGQFSHMPLWLLQIVCFTIAMLVTNICSNTVTASIFIPVVANIASSIGVNPLNLMLPTTIACSFAFILPAGTPPNAIVFAKNAISVSQMAYAGVIVSFATLWIVTLYLNIVAPIMFPLKEFPEWALVYAQNITKY
ncbi:Sodium/sulphate symporter family-containing protein [Strongyloides ratti]|uniref:Sodium/sulphate symporter family-containing protein n=1 Tax=Strongyloides ratti TaxID=34506 RepID=A0A090KTD5_STRRB|nr:Sodium/sulphate symporter family-containing protein [Strongyloides ratti]CEF60661.1 Sodium/sulphate symporter family-containing protein [Strongyloides ratti]